MKTFNKKEKRKSIDTPSQAKIKLKAADEVSEFAENIINTVREPLLLLDKELRVVKASHSFYPELERTGCRYFSVTIFS